MSNYNATVYEYFHETNQDETSHEPQVIGVFVCHAEEINGQIQITRSNGVQFTGYEDKIVSLKVDDERFGKAGDPVAMYDFYMRLRSPRSEFKILMDNCEGYRLALCGARPPAFRC